MYEKLTDIEREDGVDEGFPEDRREQVIGPRRPPDRASGQPRNRCRSRAFPAFSLTTESRSGPSCS